MKNSGSYTRAITVSLVVYFLCKIVVDGMFCNLLFNFSIPEVGMIYPSEFSCIKLSFSLVYRSWLQLKWWVYLQVETYSTKSIDLVTVLEAILTSRQPREKLQCLYENVMSKDFRKTAVLRKI